MLDSDQETVDDTTPETKEDKIKSAIEIKARGNDAFKNKDFENAKNLYKDAITKLGSSSPDLASQLHNNASAAYLASGDYFEAIRHATKVLDIDPNNEKALFRRAQANMLCGYPEEAKADANSLLKINPDSKDAVRIIKQSNYNIKESEQKQKKAFKGIFDKTAGMYEQMEKAAKEQAKENSRETATPPQTKHQSPPDPPQQTLPDSQAKTAPQSPVQSPRQQVREEEEDEDDEDVKIINETKKMGYCYFQNHAKKAEQHIKSLKSRTVPTPNPGVPTPVSGENRALSSWNSQGTTYEEKSVSKWALEAFEKHIKGAPGRINEPGAEFVVKEVRNLEGDATISVIRSSKRYMFDFTCTIDLKISYNEAEEYNIKLKMQDISSELVSGNSWKDEMHYSLEGVKDEAISKVSASVELFKDALCCSIANFFEDFKRLD